MLKTRTDGQMLTDPIGCRFVIRRVAVADKNVVRHLCYLTRSRPLNRSLSRIPFTPPGSMDEPVTGSSAIARQTDGTERAMAAPTPWSYLLQTGIWRTSA